MHSTYTSQYYIKRISVFMLIKLGPSWSWSYGS